MRECSDASRLMVEEDPLDKERTAPRERRDARKAILCTENYKLAPRATVARQAGLDCAAEAAGRPPASLPYRGDRLPPVYVPRVVSSSSSSSSGVVNRRRVHRLEAGHACAVRYRRGAGLWRGCAQGATAYPPRARVDVKGACGDEESWQAVQLASSVQSSVRSPCGHGVGE